MIIFVSVEGTLPWLIFLLQQRRQLMCKVPKKLVQCAFSPSETKLESLKLSWSLHWCPPTTQHIHLKFVNIPPMKDEGYYTYYLIVGGILSWLIEVGIRSLPLLSNRHKNPLAPTPKILQVFRFIAFALCLVMTCNRGTFLKEGTELGYCLLLGPLMWPTLGPSCER
jgi:hypothetical protein